MFTSILTRDQVRQVDRRAIDEYGMSGLVLMENAGRGVADTLLTMGVHGPVVVCCGKGNNGGDGFVIARHLDNRGKAVSVLLLAEPAELRGDAATNWHVLVRAGIKFETFGKGVTAAQLKSYLAEADWVVDALLGTGASGEPQPPYSAAIEAINGAVNRVMAVDVPSGLDCDTGVAATQTITAEHTCTFVAAKPGFYKGDAQHYTGRVHVIDIGVPRRLLRELTSGQNSNSFSDAN